LKTAAQAFAENPAATHSPTAVSCCEATEAAGARQPSQAGQRTIRRAKADRIGEIQVTQEKLVAVGGPTSDREPARYIRKKLGIEGKQGVPEIGIDRGRKTHASRRMEIKRQPW
jgi:hypothetical protein